MPAAAAPVRRTALQAVVLIAQEAIKNLKGKSDPLCGPASQRDPCDQGVCSVPEVKGVSF